MSTELKMNRDTYEKLIFLRDLSPNEVAVLGETLPEDPLHVIDIHLVKQVVNSASADLDPEDITRHIGDCIERGVYPINSERIWIHTHPMTGTGSANPSAKDMATWNCPENDQKNFMVMMILSKSGEVTAKLRVRQEVQGINGLTMNLVHERDLKFVIVDNIPKISDLEIQTILLERYGQTALDEVSSVYLYDAYMKHVKYAELRQQYNQLVTVETPKVTYTGGYSGNTNHVGYNNYTKKNETDAKIEPNPKTAAGILLLVSEHIDSTNPLITENDLNKINIHYKAENVLQVKRVIKQFNEHVESEMPLNSIMAGVIAAPTVLGHDHKIRLKSAPMPTRIAFVNAARLTYKKCNTYIKEVLGDE